MADQYLETGRGTNSTQAEHLGSRIQVVARASSQ